MSTVLTTIDLNWLAFDVDLDSVASWLNTNFQADGYCGASADSQLHLHFTTHLADADIAAIEAYWNGLTNTSPEVVSYQTKKNAAKFAAIAGAAMDFGQSLVKQIAGENLQLGITQAGMTKTVRLTMAEVIDCLQTGSLVEAIAEIKAIPTSAQDSKFVTPARLLWACNQLEQFCGLPLSTSLS